MKIFTTGQVARICQVSTSTVNKWLDSNRLKGFRVPGSQFRRIPRPYLIRFMKKHHLDLSSLEPKILIVTQDQTLLNGLKSQLSREELLLVKSAISNFECGIQAQSFHPNCVIVDFSIGHEEALEICQNLRKNTTFTATILVALLPENSPPSFDESCVNETFKQPFDTALLTERLLILLGIRTEPLV